jgi:hypothetical protein
MNKCKHEGCKTDPQTDNDYCFWHDPEKSNEQAAARIKGGQNSRRYVAIPDAEPPKTAHQVAETMATVIAGMLKGEIDPRIANGVAYCSNALLKALEVSELEARLDKVESQMGRGKR